MRVLIVHDAIPANAREDERDALVQAKAISEALGRLGHSVDVTWFTLDLEATADRIRACCPDCIFNLVESVGGHGRLIHLGPALFDTLKIPCTGADVASMVITTSKVLTRRFLYPVPMPRCLTPADLAGGANIACAVPRPRTGALREAKFIPGRYIIKSNWEEASLGLDDESVVDAGTADELVSAIKSREPQLGGEAFAEQYIDGREFNLSLLAGGPDGDVEVLPAAEIRFVDFPESKPRIVSYAAKWHEASFEYRNTPRSFDFPRSDSPLIERLSTMARACWSRAGLRGYARVDFRVDEAGEPYILEINANPCLSPDAGFAAAAAQAGLGSDDVIRRILDAALAH
jgi:D-alanine-D-alanine ligase